jgi:small ligand-binding sensory domain FIST
MLFVTKAHVDATAEIAAAVRDTLRPGTLVGATAVSVVAGDREIEDLPAVSLWAGRLEGATGVRFSAHRDGSELRVAGPPSEILAASHTLILLPDPFTFPADGLVARLGATHSEIRVIGGLASAAYGPGGNRLVLDDEVFSDGAVGLALSGPTQVTTVVSQGCRPVGKPFVVTAAEGTIIHELAGRPAYEQLVAVVGGLDESDRSLATRGLHIGRVVDEYQVEFERGDFLIRDVMAADPKEGTVTVGDVVPIGSTIQFQVRDAASADEDLRELLDGQAADGALLFTCNGRGSRFFGTSDHDAALVSKTLDGVPVGGMFCAGEVGPVGPRSFLHGYTASLALFHDP